MFKSQILANVRKASADTDGPTDITFRSSEAAFDSALRTGQLSTHPEGRRPVGRYMYMYSKAGRDYFKHIDTRQYVSASYRP